MFNLLGLFRLASIGKRIGMDLWHYETSQGAGLQTALDYLLPYALKKQDWPYSQTASISTSRLVELLCQLLYISRTMKNIYKRTNLSKK